MEKKPKINSFKDLKVWQKAMDISVEVYQLTSVFPIQEIYGLTNQIRRASNSVSLNIAEGHGRNSTKSYVNFLNIANGSLNELESGLILSVRLNFLKDSDLSKINEMLNEEQKMLAALITNLESKINNKPNPKQ
jgi:four helix bundle protein